MCAHTMPTVTSAAILFFAAQKIGTKVARPNGLNAVYPTYALVDRKGIVRVVGLQPHNVENVVKKLLAEPAS